MDWLYSDTVKSHFQNPHNIMEDESSFKDDGKGLVGNPQCGDMMLVAIKVDKESRKIKDFKWKTYGCASAVGSTSMLSEMVLENGGMTLEQAWQIKPQDIMDRLGGLPQHKIHCSVLGDKALRAAITDYYRRTDQADKIPTDKGKVICNCLNVTDTEIRELVEDGVKTFNELQERTKIATGCGKCKDKAIKLFEEYLKVGVKVGH
ncbi:MAG: iron-sulfur cluster assembly scaffold protein [Candidatus Margulisiibacteriota bacterium]|jgi:NifU-like protein involved in Fe-S cluster formation/bacterioferritin-associated ferredoxin